MSESPWQRIERLRNQVSSDQFNAKLAELLEEIANDPEQRAALLATPELDQLLLEAGFPLQRFLAMAEGLPEEKRGGMPKKKVQEIYDGILNAIGNLDTKDDQGPNRPGRTR